MHIRRATGADVEPIVAMLADDQLGRQRESAADPAPYRRAFEAIDGDPNQFLAVAEDAGEVIGTLQLTFIPGLSRKGATRALVEAVRVRSDRRGDGLGAVLMKWAVEEARRRGCALVQLTSDASRTGAHRFYLRLGFEQSHFGFKLTL
ncbi:GNAT family N-acetyltransferase [Amycolatopsis acidiphila]|uniref:GNAT family N-acetyltransferase n=1 Tax=Amycolatopsis acidiphila TaxID=715473 RepID=UPI001E3C1C00|nr:GNAT family N-acetyltransferase [Amycolatopsis acidiphila]UIJ63782.1 GNAT family N-acetyltransferase [Amycolatopsis acidiphila]